MLSDGLEGWDGREAHEGGNIYILVADWCFKDNPLYGKK